MTSRRLSRRRKLRVYLTAFLACVVAFGALCNLYLGITRQEDHQQYAKWPGAPFIQSTGMATGTSTSEPPLSLLDRSLVNLTRFLAKPPNQREPTHTACDNQNYKGIYPIVMGDRGGAAGTIFFQFIISQILYAEQHQLLPWIHLNGESHVVYDPIVHTQGNGYTLDVPRILNASYTRPRRWGHMKDRVPGDPTVVHSDSKTSLRFSGTGVWEHYFVPIHTAASANNLYIPGDRSCAHLPVVQMDLFLITPGLHGYADYTPKCWRYPYLSDYITKPHIPLGEWLEGFRKTAGQTIREYNLRLRPEIEHYVDEHTTGKICHLPNYSCLGLHIRHSDKAAGRRVVEVDEFLPYVRSWVHAIEQASQVPIIWLATDSTQVMKHVDEVWPHEITQFIRTLGGDEDHAVLRSGNKTAVFDLGKGNTDVLTGHHRTNVEVLVEIRALSHCHYLIHGLSAVSESSIWMGSAHGTDLHRRSVNLEDPHRFSVSAFASRVRMDVTGRDDSTLRRWPLPAVTTPWWSEKPKRSTLSKQDVCGQYKGILHISSVNAGDGAGRAFFSTVLNQLLYAEQHQLMPFIHLQPPIAGEESFIYDDAVHGTFSTEEASVEEFSALSGVVAAVRQLGTNTLMGDSKKQMLYPGAPAKRASASGRTVKLYGTGVWSSYFDAFEIPSVKCRSSLPWIEWEKVLVRNAPLYAPWAIRAWRYDGVPDELWSVERPLNDLLLPMRSKARKLIQKYYQPRPYILRRAAEVLRGVKPCLGVHWHAIDKKGLHRSKSLSLDTLLVPYLRAFVEAGGRCIYVATDSRSVLQRLQSYGELSSHIHTQGEFVVRSSKKRSNAAREFPTHRLDTVHRVTTETLVDILVLSKCQMLLHAFSTVSEAAIYFSEDIKSINLEDPHRMSVETFVAEARNLVSASSQHNDNSLTIASPSTTRVQNATVFQDTSNECQRNAIVYLAQKHHSSYNHRNSFASLLKSIDLLRVNYLQRFGNAGNVDVFVFHTGDFDTSNDYVTLREHLGGSSFRGILHLVDLSQNSPYWRRPKQHRKDNPSDWYAWPLFSEGYRHMMHWFAMGIWDFFDDWNNASGCQYRYIWRLDEDSYIHSPIWYNMFEMMEANQYVYGFRMCAYELRVAKRMWVWWNRQQPKDKPTWFQREWEPDLCGFYNNFFVADLSFFRSDPVQKYLKFIDRHGQIYRRRLGDLMIHSLVVYAYAPREKIHRFLDFTYEHATLNGTDGCLLWGGIQSGYNDPTPSTTLDPFHFRYVLNATHCTTVPIRESFLGAPDLSPSYAHLQKSLRKRIDLLTITAGDVELPQGKAILSG